VAARPSAEGAAWRVDRHAGSSGSGPRSLSAGPAAGRRCRRGQPACGGRARRRRRGGRGQRVGVQGAGGVGQTAADAAAPAAEARIQRRGAVGHVLRLRRGGVLHPVWRGASASRAGALASSHAVATAATVGLRPRPHVAAARPRLLLEAGRRRLGCLSAATELLRPGGWAACRTSDMGSRRRRQRRWGGSTPC